MLVRVARWVRAEAAFVVVVLMVVAAAWFLFLFPGHWRRGTVLIGLALVSGAGLRLMLPAPRVGMLAVRGRWRDALTYLAIGVVILGVAIRLH
jgi:hypothetical protein